MEGNEVDVAVGECLVRCHSFVCEFLMPRKIGWSWKEMVAVSLVN